MCLDHSHLILLCLHIDLLSNILVIIFAFCFFIHFLSIFCWYHLTPLHLLSTNLYCAFFLNEFVCSSVKVVNYQDETVFLRHKVKAGK